MAILVGSRDHQKHFWKGDIQGQFHQSLVAIGPVVSEEKIKMWKFTTDSKWWQKLIWPLARWAKNIETKHHSPRIIISMYALNKTSESHVVVSTRKHDNSHTNWDCVNKPENSSSWKRFVMFKWILVFNHFDPSKLKTCEQHNCAILAFLYKNDWCALPCDLLHILLGAT